MEHPIEHIFAAITADVMHDLPADARDQLEAAFRERRFRVVEFIAQHDGDRYLGLEVDGRRFICIPSAALELASLPDD